MCDASLVDREEPDHKLYVEPRLIVPSKRCFCQPKHSRLNQFPRRNVIDCG